MFGLASNYDKLGATLSLDILDHAGTKKDVLVFTRPPT